jgi:cation transport ATPase
MIINMDVCRGRGLVCLSGGAVWVGHGFTWLARHSAVVLLTLTASGLAVGLGLHLAGAGGAGDAAWAAVGVVGAGYALWAMGEALAHRRIGVDVIALLALAGALAVGELLAAAVISVMLASGRALEEWAAGRARRDLHALLERAPRTARR